MFDRIIKFIGEDNFNKINNSSVLVIGLGGVGGTCVEALIRSGISNIIIVDYDKVDISNLNRQVITNLDNIGLYKTDVMEKYILSINKDCNVIKVNKRIDLNNIEDLFSYDFDYLIDCCDSINIKCELIRICLDKNITFISSMGTGNKIDPTMLKIMDIRDTSYDPVAKRIRKYVSDNKIRGNIPVVCSCEQNDRFDGSIPSMIFVPSYSGLLCANYIIRKIIEK